MPRKAVVAGAAAAALSLGVAGSVPLARLAIDRFEDLDLDDVAVPGSRRIVRGVGLRYIDMGAGFPIVLIHGFGGSAYDYRLTLPALAEHCRVIAVDLPGFGYSDRGAATEISGSAWVDTLAELLAQLGVTRAVFVGHSLGGAVVERFAARYPEMVERLVLVAAVSAGDRRPMPPAGALFTVIATLVQGLLAASSRLERLAQSRTVYDPSFMTGDVLAGHIQPLRVRGSAAAVRRLFRGSALDQPVDLSRLTMPVLLLWGDSDKIVRLTVAEQLLAALPHARLEVVAEAGHLVLEEHPETCNRIILDFLQDLASRPPQPGHTFADSHA